MIDEAAGIAAAADAPRSRQHLLMLAPIAVTRGDDGWRTLDLWARDVNTQARLLDITLLCPVRPNADTPASATLDPSISVVDNATPLDEATLRALVRAADFVQVPGNAGWHGSALARRLLLLARDERKVGLLGISSNRALTAWLNSRGRGVRARLIGAARYADIRLSQRWLARRAAGVCLVGEALRPLVAGVNARIHVDTASWIEPGDIVRAPRVDTPVLRICMAGRLERMKGFDLGIEAVASLDATTPRAITIVGAGPEEQALRGQAKSLCLDVRFLPPVAYPHPFLELLDQHDLVLMTNRSDEQPRLVFDAIARGCLPLCPDHPAYRALSLPPELLYGRADAADLGRAIMRVSAPERRADLRARTVALAERYTLDTMHRARIAWMTTL